MSKQHRQLARIFSVDYAETKASLGFPIKRDDPVLEAVQGFQDAIVAAAEVVVAKRRPNPHADAPLPETAAVLVANCGDAWLKAIRGKFSEAYKIASHFGGGRFFPLFIYGREESPYSRLTEEIVRNPQLVGMDKPGFTEIVHRGHPFPSSEDASA